MRSYAEIIESLSTEADLCCNETATDIAELLDEAKEAIESLLIQEDRCCESVNDKHCDHLNNTLANSYYSEEIHVCCWCGRSVSKNRWWHVAFTTRYAASRPELEGHGRHHPYAPSALNHIITHT